MSTILAPGAWPRELADDATVVNGQIPRVSHGLQIESAILHLLGFGYQSGGFCSNLSDLELLIAQGASRVVPIWILPFAKHVRIDAVAYSTDTLIDCVLDVSADTVGSSGFDWVFQAGTVNDADQFAEFKTGTIYNIGSGTAVAPSRAVITLTNNSGGITSIRIAAFKMTQVFNRELTV